MLDSDQSSGDDSAEAPRRGLSHDWETDPRPYDEALKAWRTAHGWTWQQTADELREPLDTIRLHAKGRFPADTRQKRRLMTLIDHHLTPPSAQPPWG